MATINRIRQTLNDFENHIMFEEMVYASYVKRLKRKYGRI